MGAPRSMSVHVKYSHSRNRAEWENVAFCGGIREHILLTRGGDLTLYNSQPKMSIAHFS